MGIKALRSIRLGRETTAGTAVAATTYWRGEGTIEDRSEHVFPNEDVGLVSGTDRSYIPKKEAAITFDQTPATFEQLPVVLQAAVKLVATGVTDTGGSGKVYAFTFPTTSVNTFAKYTIEGGDDSAAEEMPYSFVESFELSGAGGEAWMVSANWVGREVNTSAFTGGATIPTVYEILFGKSKLYIDAVGGTMGTTEKSATLLSASLKVTTGIKAVYTGSGEKYFSHAVMTKPEVLLDLVYEHNSSAAAEKAAWVAGTPRQIRINTDGNALTTAGTFTYKTMRIDLAGKYEKFDKIGEQDGNDIISATFRAGYDSTCAKFAEIKVVNETASY